MTETAVETPLVTILRRTVHARRFWTSFALVLASTIAIWAPFRIDHWLTHDDGLFIGMGASQTGHVSVGHTFYTGIGPLGANRAVADASHRVDMSSVTPFVAENTSNATISMLLCHDKGQNLGSGGSTIDDVNHYCTDLRPFTRETTEFGPRDTTLILTITPQRPGVVRVPYSVIKYRHGLRTGQVDAGTATTILTP